MFSDVTLVGGKFDPKAEGVEKLSFSGLLSSHKQILLQGLISLWFSSLPSALL